MDRRWLIGGIVASFMVAAACLVALAFQPTSSCSASASSDGTRTPSTCTFAPRALDVILGWTMLSALGLGIVGGFALIANPRRGSPERAKSLRIGALLMGTLLLIPTGLGLAVWTTALPNVHFEHMNADGTIDCGQPSVYSYGQAPPSRSICVQASGVVSTVLLLAASVLLVVYYPVPRRGLLVGSAILGLMALAVIYGDDWFGGHPNAQSDARDIVVLELLLIGLALLGFRDSPAQVSVTVA
ncbi:MAG: hypothetical protein WDA16_00120 [Candidatus Thermoplasmatota archaeon]